MMTVMMMNDDVDDEIEDSGNHFHSKMSLEYNSQKPFPQQNGFGIPVRWWWWMTMLMMRLKIPVVMMMNDGDDSVCFRVWFFLFCFVLFGFLWGCRKQLCWDLCTLHKDFLMHHSRSLIRSPNSQACFLSFTYRKKSYNLNYNQLTLYISKQAPL